jgi:putative addiction module component (TIGR02574 family)
MNSFSDIQKLSIGERLDLLEQVWESLVADHGVPDLTLDQKLEIDQRLEAYDANPSLQGRPWSEVKKRFSMSN